MQNHHSHDSLSINTLWITTSSSPLADHKFCVYIEFSICSNLILHASRMQLYGFHSCLQCRTLWILYELICIRILLPKANMTLNLREQGVKERTAYVYKPASTMHCILFSRPESYVLSRFKNVIKLSLSLICQKGQQRSCVFLFHFGLLIKQYSTCTQMELMIREINK